MTIRLTECAQKKGNWKNEEEEEEEEEEAEEGRR
jgi:hypothetical protein